MPRCGRRLNASVHGQTWNEPNSILGREVSGPAAYQLPVDLILFLTDGFISCSFLSRHALADGGYMYRMSYDLHSFMQQQQQQGMPLQMEVICIECHMIYTALCNNNNVAALVKFYINSFMH